METVISVFILGSKTFLSSDKTRRFCRVSAYLEDTGVVSFFVPDDLHGTFVSFIKSYVDIRIRISSYDGLPSWKFIELA